MINAGPRSVHEDVRACVRDHRPTSSKKWKTPSRNKGHSVRHHVTSCSKTIQGWCLFVSHGVEWLKNLALQTHRHVLYLLRVRCGLIWSYTHKTTLSLNSGKIPRNQTPWTRECEHKAGKWELRSQREDEDNEWKKRDGNTVSLKGVRSVFIAFYILNAQGPPALQKVKMSRAFSISPSCYEGHIL